MEIPFIPSDLVDEWSKRLTGRKLENKMYVIVHIEGKNPLAMYRVDDAVGLIRLLAVK